MATSKFVTEVLARREISLERTEDLAASMRNTFLGIRRDAQRIVNRNLREFTENGRYVDTAEARRAAERTVAEVNSTLRNGLSGAETRLSDAKIRHFRSSALDLKFALEKSTNEKVVLGGSFGQIFDEAAERASRAGILGVSADRQLARTGAFAGQRYREAITQGVIRGEGADQVAQRIEAIGDRTGAAAQRIARNNLNQVANDAHRAVYEANDDIFIGYRWDSTFDSRTSAICARLHGTFYKLGSKPPGPPAHHNCRSLLVGVFRDPEVEQDISSAPRRVRHFEPDGTEIKPKKLVPANQSFEEWMRSQPKVITQQITGSPTKERLWRTSRIGLDDIVGDDLLERGDRAVLRRAWSLNPDDKEIAALARDLGLKRPVSIDTIIREDLRLQSSASHTLGSAGEQTQSAIDVGLEVSVDAAQKRKIRSLQSKQSRARRALKELEEEKSRAVGLDTKASVQRRINAEQLKIDEAGREITRIKGVSPIQPPPPPPPLPPPNPPPTTTLRAANEAISGDSRDYVTFGRGKDALADSRAAKAFDQLQEASELRALTSAEEELLLALTTPAENQILIFEGDNLISGLVWSERDGRMLIEHFGSIGKGGGTRAIHQAMRDAASRGLILEGQSTDGAIGFYRSIGVDFSKDPRGEGWFTLAGKDLDGSLSITTRRIRPILPPDPVPPPPPPPVVDLGVTKAQAKKKLASVQSSLSRRRRKVRELSARINVTEGAERERLIWLQFQEGEAIAGLTRQRDELKVFIKTGRSNELNIIKRRELDRVKPKQKLVVKPTDEIAKLEADVAAAQKDVRAIEAKLAEVERLRREASKKRRAFPMGAPERMDFSEDSRLGRIAVDLGRDLTKAQQRAKTFEKPLFVARREGQIPLPEQPLGLKPKKIVSSSHQAAINKAKREMDALGLTDEVLRERGPDAVLEALRALKGTGLSANQQGIIDRLTKQIAIKRKRLSKSDQDGLIEALTRLLEATDDSVTNAAALRKIRWEFKSGRASAENIANKITLDAATAGNRVAVHEFAHHMQYRHSPSRTRMQQWQADRTRGESTHSLYSGRKEVGRTDDFYNVYVGREYSGRGFQEGMAMGVQTLFDRQSFDEMLRKDLDHLRLIWSMLRGY